MWLWKHIEGFFLILFHTIYKLDFTLNQLLISFSVEQICNPHSLFCEKEHHLLSSADKHRREEAKSHPQFIQTRLVICDVSETRGGSLKKKKKKHKRLYQYMGKNML